jgi:hypothetical protein
MAEECQGSISPRVRPAAAVHDQARRHAVVCDANKVTPVSNAACWQSLPCVLS